jgi:hypothetical protein
MAEERDIAATTTMAGLCFNETRLDRDYDHSSPRKFGWI